jgi:hypothetical protein
MKEMAILYHHRRAYESMVFNWICSTIVPSCTLYLPCSSPQRRRSCQPRPLGQGPIETIFGFTEIIHLAIVTKCPEVDDRIQLGRHQSERSLLSRTMATARGGRACTTGFHHASPPGVTTHQDQEPTNPWIHPGRQTSNASSNLLEIINHHTAAALFRYKA